MVFAGPDDLKAAGNTLTQRSLRTATNVVTVALDLGGMADGQFAGLCHFSREYSLPGVRQTGETRTIEIKRGQSSTPGPVITSRQIWLRSTWGLGGRSDYSYSVDGTNFTAFGETYQLGWGNYRGDRIGIYSYNNKAEAGYVDVDWFRYRYSSPANQSQ